MSELEKPQLILAVPSKGRLQENAAAFFARAGLQFVQGRGAREGEGIRIEISNPLPPQPGTAGNGHGLRSVRQRVVFRYGPRAVVEARGLRQVTDTGAIDAAIEAVIAANPAKVEEVKAKPKLAAWFVGQVMKQTGGKANPAAVNAALKTRLNLPDEG